MPYTHLALGPVLNPLFQQCIHDCNNVPRVGIGWEKRRGPIQKRCVDDATREVTHQGEIYIREENAYCNKVKVWHEEAKNHAARLVQYAQDLAEQWDDNKFEAMPVMLERLHEIAREREEESAQMSQAHLGWRGEGGWDRTNAKLAIGAPADAELLVRFKHIRQPGVDAVAGVKPLIVKLQEYCTRGESSLKAAQTASLAKKAKGSTGAFLKEVEDLETGAQEAARDIHQHTETHEDGAQRFIALCNTNHGVKPPENEIRSATVRQQAAELYIKNDKSKNKTLDVQQKNLLSRVDKSVSQGQVNQMKGKLAELAHLIEADRRKLDQFADLIRAHGVKLEEAKQRH